MITLETIRERLVKEIKESKMSQAELAQKVGVRQPTIAQYVSGRAMPALDTFANLCNVLQVSSDYILGISDSKY